MKALIKSSLLARNTALNLIGQALPLLVAIATIPLVIRGLGTERFGSTLTGVSGNKA
jgi:O-antigen/teichoic acid export membrane protein